MSWFRKNPFAPDPQIVAASDLYMSLVAQARNAVLYRDLAVPDTTAGRYAMIALHAFLVMDRLGRDADQGETSQALFDVMFADMDRNLREMGVGDLSVGKRVKSLAGHFYAMAAALRDGLNRSEEALCRALTDHVYGGDAPSPGILEAMAAYIRACVAELAAQSADDIAMGRIRLPDPSLEAKS